MTLIVKASGEKALFDAGKLYRSLKRAGTDEFLIEEVVADVEKALTEGMSTREIYRIAYRLLRKKSKIIAAKYHLKFAIMRLGLSGFPFEKYIAEIIRHQGFQVQNNQIIKGHCAHHEVDVVAKRQDHTIFVECKYHNRLGIKCDVKIPLYFKARFMDIEQAYPRKKGERLAGWLVTNTKFTSDAIQYGLCAGLHLIDWSFPAKGSLRELIEFSGLYPIPCISGFTKAEIAQLLADNVILCKTISHNPMLLQKLNISKPRWDVIIEQCRSLNKSP